HQAVEAKEGVAIEKETKTYATITIQNYFRLYEKLAGMTGTAETEAQEFHDIYGLNVMAIPTNVPCQRKDNNDVIYKTRREKFNAAIAEIEAAHSRGQPVLVGTASVEASEVLSRMLKRQGIEHTVLNAKHHQQEAEIVANAGQRGAVTIATNMAGRGTDIKLGEGVNELGGLYVLGTERHESRRIDRQLRGRCARQGDNGLSKFLVSLEDDLLRIFGSGPLARILNNTFQEGAPLDHPLLNRSIERAQKTVEGQNYSMRKRLLQFDDVLNKQREIIYGLRNECMHSDTPRKLVFDFIIDELDERISNIMPADGSPEPEALQELCSWVTSRIPMAIIPEQLEGKDAEGMRNAIMNELEEVYKIREEVEDANILKSIERFVVLHALDKNWQDHLTEMEDLRRSIGLRGYGQKDPLNEYKSEAFKFFEDLIRKIRNDVLLGLFRSASSIEVLQAMLEKLDIKTSTEHNEQQPAKSVETKSEPKLKIPEIQLPKIGRNDTVVISKGGEFQEMKFKKAERLIKEEGWRLEKW
ncbi:MAG: preprotein translocase subunit SecA, partial [Opitutales bacterium]|nr:preprotein translocase subunit SecA [Opitutales bacterium]